jgi:hypothetical protein
MEDTVTIVIVHVSRQCGEALLNIAQELGLDASPNFPQSENKFCQFVSR